MTDLMLAGYRLVRKLGEGRRAEVYLGHSQADAAGSSSVVAVKIYKPDHEDPEALDVQIMNEIEALGRARGDHVVELVDLSTAPSGFPVLLLQRLGSTTISRLLEERDRLELGEVITLVAPIAGALRRMHHSGVAHGGIGPGAVLFDSIGAPVLARFGRLSLIPVGLPPIGLQRELGVLKDVSAVLNLTEALLARVRGDGAEELAARIKGAAMGDDFLEVLSCMLFEHGDPLPVHFPTETPRDQPTVPQRIFIGEPVLEANDSGMKTALASFGLPEFIERMIPARTELARKVHCIAAAIRGVRLRMWLIAASVALTSLVVVALTSQGPTAPSIPRPIESAPTAPVVAPASDDPLGALPMLLDARERCITAMSIVCLDDVDQAGSSALAFDYSVVKGLQAGGEAPTWDIDATGAEVIERIGDVALIGLTSDTPDEPQGVLLMNGSHGWLIRDYQFE